MTKRNPQLRWTGILVFFAALSGVCLSAQGAQEPGAAPPPGRPDQIKIDTLAAYGKLELPAVTFFHDKHTKALVKENKDCQTCHLVENNKLSFTFMRRQGTKPEELQSLYHTNCIGCHLETAAAGKPSGPLDGFCRSCHNAQPPTPARLDAGMDKTLHYRHLASKAIPASTKEATNCSACHHVYDKQTKKIVYAAGKEESCRVCHGDKPQDGVLDLAQASHQQCVLCHLDLAGKGAKDNGPLNCNGCHGAAGQALVAKKNQEVVAKLKNKEVPRLQRGQPDAALITYVPKNGDTSGKSLLMEPVPFDHKAHEKYTDSCRGCHHASMDSCASCHTLTGAKEGKLVTFEQAMHSKSSKHSCIGCHAAKQAPPNCAGCHNRIEESRQPESATCKLCHLPLGKTTLAGSGARMTPQQRAEIAESMLKERPKSPGTYSLGSLPAKVEIRELTDKYQPVELDHGKHVQALLKGMEGNQLAQYFHHDPGTMCQGCHHNSPASATPPRCSSCHPRYFDPKHPKRPGLQAAFHGQCMGCHKDMAVKPVATACTECHLEKQK